MSMTYEFAVREIGMTPGMMKRQWNRLAKEAYRRVGVTWFKQMRPKHFTHAGAKEYGYKPRQGERGSGMSLNGRIKVDGKSHQTYTARKLRLYGHTKPLVFTGDTQRSTRRGRVIATSKRVRVRMPAPKLNYNPRLRLELTKISAREADTLASRWEAVMQQQVNNFKGKRGPKKKL